jgi:hypothetical protein
MRFLGKNMFFSAQSNLFKEEIVSTIRFDFLKTKIKQIIKKK